MTLALDKAIIMNDGSALTVEEIFEALLRLANSEASFPLLSDADKAKAVISVAFEALAYDAEAGVLE